MMMEKIFLGVLYLTGWLVSSASCRQYIFVTHPMNWTEAQTYCRKNYTDLATIENAEEMNQLNNTVSSSGNESAYVWIGLYAKINWVPVVHSEWNSAENQTVLWAVLSNIPDIFWSDGSNLSFSNLNGFPVVPTYTRSLCGVTPLHKPGKWTFLECDNRVPFVCYIAPPPPSPPPPPATVMRQIVKVKIKVGDSVDLEDLAVKAKILKQYQEKLKDKGMSGVKLRWREQPDGKVFHKEKKKKKKKDEFCS